MFPTTNKESRNIIKQLKNIPGFSPKISHQNRSTILPYFKRFPNQRFLSQDKKRTQQQQSNSIPRRFFTEEKSQMRQTSILGKFSSKGSIKQPSPLKPRPKLFRQMYQRQSTRIKRSSEASLSEKKNKFIVNSSFQIHHSANYLTPQQVLRSQHNLTSHQIDEILKYEQIYYYGQNCIKKVYSKDDNDKQQLQEQQKQGYPWSKGDHILYRYQILDLLGQGSFGQVFKCIDHKNKNNMAIKVVKNNQKYLNQAKTQIKILNTIKSKDPSSVKNCIQIKQSFYFRGRVCMTFSLLSMNLYQLIKSNGYYGLPLQLIRRFVLQVLNGIHFLHRQKIIHADLKPQNILLKQPNKSGIKIIDFGSSCFQGQTIYTYIQSRYYRAPEVILGLPYNRKIDIWSFGCIMAEVHLGYPLFAGQQQHEQICLIIQVLGNPPKDMIPNAKRWHVFFDNHNNLKPHKKKSLPASKSLSASLQNADNQFVDFIKTCLQWNPQRRVQALDLMKHPWVLKDLPQDFKDQHLKFVEEQQQVMLQQTIFKKNRKHTLSIRDKHRLIK